MTRLVRRPVFAAVVCMALVVLSAFVRMPAAVAQIAVPTFAMSPSSGPLGTTFTGAVEYYSGVPDRPNHGCSNDVAYTVADPDGNQVAEGVLPAIIPGTPVQWFTFQVTIAAPHPLGVYTVEGLCDGFLARGDFELTGPANPPPVLSVTPRDQSRAVDDRASVTARFVDGETGTPIADAEVLFQLSGPNTGTSGACAPVSCRTDASGSVVWSYAGLRTGQDLVVARVGADPAGPEALAWVTWTESVHGKAYGALGDSFSSGEGTDDYQLETDLSGYNTCHRSDLAYGPLADDDRGLGDMSFRACSGALTSDLFQPNHDGNRLRSGDVEAAQLCQPGPTAPRVITPCPAGVVPAVGPKTTVITLTIGGNDAGFKGVVQQCIYGSWLIFTHGEPGRGCSREPSLVDPTVRRLQALAGQRSETISGRKIYSIADVLGALHQVAPNAHIYIAGYPRLFGVKNGTCKVGALQTDRLGMVDLKVDPHDARWLDDMADLLNSIIAKAVRSAGPWATFVDVAPRFANHSVCSADPWINPISGTKFDDVQPVGLTVYPRSLHPTIRGQHDGYESAFLAAYAGT